MITEMNHLIKNKQYLRVMKPLLYAILPKFIDNVIFLKNHKRLVNFKDPKEFDEKLLCLKCGVYFNNKVISQCTDKLGVRDFVISKNCSEILNDLLGVYKSVDEINFDQLPDRFVLKCNHGCGYNIIVHNKDAADKDKIVSKLNYWLQEDYGILSGEYQYKAIPRVIICEKYLGADDGTLPIDYKFFCSRGNVICVLVFIGRGGKQERIYVDTKYEDLKLICEYTGEDYKVTRPASFDKMVEVAKVLSRDFPFVRVDLYDVHGRVVFGELTFTPHGCNHEYLGKDAQLWIGKQITL